MALLEENENYCFESDAGTYDSDDSKNDPTFDILEDTKSKFSQLSVRRKTKPRASDSNDIDDESDGEEPDIIQVDETELDENDQKSYEKVQNMIQAGEIEKLKVDQCKVYLRKHRLRLTGNKATLIQRIKEHIEILNGGGEKKYPVSSFVLNCKGDACTGDIVFFEQNVYEMFSIASRSATGPPCGTRVVAGRIVKESYGMAKQQHTFTIEVLWSKGEKPLPALHPLLIKGRNLYRLKTMRQRWEDEGQRQKSLSEKHTRGSVARANREARVEKKKLRNELKLNRVVKAECPKQQTLAESKENIRHMPSMNLEKSGNEPQNGREMNLPKPLCHVSAMPSHDRLHQRPPLTAPNVMRNPLADANLNTFPSYITHYAGYNAPARGAFLGNTCSENVNSNFPVYPARMWHGNRNPSHQVHNRNSFDHGNAAAIGLGHDDKRQPCRFYAQGRCYYGHNCKYLH